MNRIQLVSILTDFANTAYVHNKRMTHSHGGVWDKYPCANPDGPVDNSDCDDDDPLCNCPCQELKPDSEEQLERINKELHGENEEGDALMWSVSPDDMKEPTNKEVAEAVESIKECTLIKSVLGEKYLGCLWKHLDHPSSCNCPCVGEKFGEYLDYTRTYATYWDTENSRPLLRNAQMSLVNSEKSFITVMPDLTLRPGTCIYVVDPASSNDTKESKFGGRWLVSAIMHSVGAFPLAADMTLALIRGTQTTDPNEKDSSDTKNIIDRIKDIMGI